MYKHNIILVSIVIILFSTVFGVYYVFQIPTVVNSYETLLDYNQKGSFEYFVYLKPNLLYDETVLREEGGVYFRNITDYIDVRFRYRFVSNEPLNVAATLYTADYLMATSGNDVLWSKEIDISSNSSIPFNGNEFTLDFQLNPESIYEIIERIEGDIKVRSTQHWLRIKADVILRAENEKGVIEEVLENEMNIDIDPAIIRIEPTLSQEKPGSIEKLNVTYFPWVNDWRLYSIIILGAAITVTTSYYLLVYRKIKNVKKSKIKEILKKYSDLILRANNHSGNKKSNTVVTVSSINDLLKVSEHTMKPIIYEEKQEKENTHFFYVQDSNVKYELNVEENEVEIEEDEVDLKPVDNPHNFASSIRVFLGKKIVIKRR